MRVFSKGKLIILLVVIVLGSTACNVIGKGSSTGDVGITAPITITKEVKDGEV